MTSQSIQSKIKQRQELLLQNLAQDFSLDGVNKSPARFDLKKLQSINSRFIRMMELEEFAYRAQATLNHQRNDELRSRITDIALLVDVTKQTVYCNYADKAIYEDGLYHCIGGGREEGESSIDSLTREIAEETDSKIHADKSRLLPITDYQLIWGYSISKSEFSGRYVGLESKLVSAYFYEVSENTLDTYTDPDGGHEFRWYNLVDVLASNRYLTYPIYKEFCTHQGIPYPQPSRDIIQQYCAWLLDKNRITVLSEFGTESRCILDWKQPELEDVKWRKSSMQDSLSNLMEIMQLIEDTYDHNPHNYPERIDQIEYYMEQSSAWWEDTIKTWLNKMAYQAGDYLWPLRVTLSGQTKSPSPFEILAILTKQEAIKRAYTVYNFSQPQE